MDTHLKPPSSSSTPHRIPSPSSASSSTASSSRPPLSSHPTATIAETVLLQGSHPITIAAESILHPRARIYSFHGAVTIGKGCVIGEKAVIGSPPDLVDLNHNPTLGDGKGKGEGEGEGGKGGETIISDFVAISPLSSIRSGTVVGEAAVIDTLCTVEGGADVGAHSKVCAGCCVPTGASVGDWMVVWGSGKAFGRRKRFRGVGSGTGSGVDAGLVEESRLVVLKKEREALSRLLVPVGAGGSRRR